MGLVMLCNAPRGILTISIQLSLYHKVLGMNNTKRIAVWPSGEWVCLREVEQYQFRGDDWRMVTVHRDMPDEVVDDIARLAGDGASDEVILGEVIYWMGG